MEQKMKKTNPIKEVRVGKNLTGMACVVRNRPIVIYLGRMSFEMDEALRAGYVLRIANLFDSKKLPKYSKSRKIYKLDLELQEHEIEVIQNAPGFKGGKDGYIAIDLIVCDTLAEAKRQLNYGVVDAA